MANERILKVKLLTSYGYLPTKPYTESAGFDLRSAYEWNVPAGDRKLIPTDIAIELPKGCYGRIAPRSGLAYNKFIDVGGGVIDADYRGNIMVCLYNHSKSVFHIERGCRIAQLICEKIYYPEVVEVKELSNTDRKEAGFGSTGDK